MTILCSRLGARFRSALFLLATCLLLSGVARGQNLNLLKNGGFELSTFNANATAAGFGAIDGSVPSNPLRASAQNWTWSPDPSVPVSQADPYSTAVYIYQSGGLPEGTKAANFGGGSAHGGGSLSQSFAATPGSSYRVSFWVQRVGSSEPISGVVTIRNNANGSNVTTQPVNMSGAPSGQWIQRTFTFVAPSNSLTLTFSDTTPLNSAGNTDLAVDNFVIETLAPKNLTILGASGSPGSIEPNTDYSKDGGLTWYPAYLFTGHPWGNIPGTNAWLNQHPSPFVGLNENVDFRIRFYVPENALAAHMTYQVNADNEADILINGTLVAHTVGGSISSGTIPSQYLVPGINTIYVRLIDYGGWVGLNYRIDISADSADPLQRISPPPSITSPLTANGTVGTPFSYTIQATNSPSTRTASNLPPGLTVNSSSGVISGTPTVAGVYNVALSATNNFGTGNNTLVITIGKGAATVTLGSLVHTYDGSEKSASATTNPAGLPVNFSYTGATLPPINAGTYGVFGAINHANYAGFSNGTLLIQKAPASVSFSNLVQPYNGSAKSVTVTTSPAGLATQVTYNGSTSAPSAIGTYAVAATVTNPNYTGSGSATLTITDTIKPVIALPSAPIVVEATGPSGANVPFTLSAEDNIDGPVSVTPSHASGSLFPLGNTLVTVNAEDAAGNVASASFTVSVVDTTAPTILMSPTAQTNVPITNASFEQNFTWDHDHSIPGWTLTGVAGVVYVPALPGRYITGVAPEGRQVGFVNDGAISQTLPITLQAGKTYTLSGFVGRRSDDPITTGRLALVTSSGVVLAQADSAPDQALATFAHHSTSFTATATDPNLGATLKIVLTNTSNQQVNFDAITLTVGDTPVSAPSDIVTEATSSQGAVVNYTATAFDIVSGTLSVSSGPVSGSTFPIGSTAVALEAIDPAGNVGTATFNVIVRDTTAPTLNIPANQTIEATSAAGAVATFDVTANDAVGALVSTSVPSGSVFPLGTTTVEVSAIDEAGNESTGSFTITVIDSTKPLLQLPANLVIEATGPAGAIATFSASATDLVDGNLSVLLAPESGSVFPIGTTAVQATATDSTGNTVSDIFTVTVVDTTAPVIAPLDNLIVEATSAAGAVVEFSPSALDIVNDAVSVTASPASGSTFALGETIVTLTATDAAGNTATTTFTVTVVDTTAPTIATPANIIAEATSADGATVIFDLSASDLVDGAVAVDSSHASGNVFPIGTTVVTLSSEDAAGNRAESSFTVLVRDTTAPVIAPLDDLVIEATSAAGATATFVANATDAVGATVSYSIAPGSTFALGTTTVTVTAADAAGNTSTASFAIVVRDTTAPALFPPTGQTLETTSAAGAVATYTASAFDIVSGSVPVSFNIEPGSTFPLGTTTVTASTIDPAGNAASAVFSIVVVDTTAPVIVTPANIVLEATGPAGAVATFAPSASDIVSGNVAVSSSNASGSVFPLGVTTVSLIATDAAGNSSSSAFTVTVVDTTAPTLTVPANILVDSTTVMGATVTFSVAASDIVDGTLAPTLSKASGTLFPIGATVVTASVTDAAGNTTTKTFTVTVRAPAAALVNQITAMNGTINGSIQQRTHYGVTLNGGAKITGELLTVGTPTTRLNGKPDFGGTVDSTGSSNPAGYTITLNGNASLGKLVRRYDATAMPTVAAPSNPTGSRSVNMNKSSDAIGSWATLQNLTLNGNVGNVTVPAGVYGNFTANGGSGFTLGVAGATTPTVYHFQNLTLNGNSAFKVVGPVIVIVKNGINVNSSMGNSANPAWLDLRVSNGGVTLNGNVEFQGYVTAPSGTVTINGNSRLQGGLVADKLVLNGNSLLTLLHR